MCRECVFKGFCSFFSFAIDGKLARRFQSFYTINFVCLNEVSLVLSAHWLGMTSQALPKQLMPSTPVSSPGAPLPEGGLVLAPIEIPNKYTEVGDAPIYHAEPCRPDYRAARPMRMKEIVRRTIMAARRPDARKALRARGVFSSATPLHALLQSGPIAEPADASDREVLGQPFSRHSWRN